MRGIGALVFALAAVASAEPSTVPVGQLSPATQEILFRTTVFAERLVRADQQRAQFVDPGPLALTPRECAGMCGDAAGFIVYLLRLQGVPADEIRVAGSDDFHPSAYPHVLVVWRTRTQDGTPVSVLIDPTFPQTEALAFRFHPDFRQRGYVQSPQNATSALEATEAGREILAQIREHGFWIPTATGYQRFAESLLVGNRGRNPEARPGDRIRPWAEFLELPAWLGSYGRHEDVAWTLKDAGLPDVSGRDPAAMDAAVRAALARLGPAERARRRTGQRPPETGGPPRPGCFGDLGDVADGPTAE